VQKAKAVQCMDFNHAWSCDSPCYCYVRVSSLQDTVSTLESVNTGLTAHLASTQCQLATAQARLSHREGELARREERERDQLVEEVTTLRKKLAAYADYDEVKRELGIMKVRHTS